MAKVIFIYSVTDKLSHLIILLVTVQFVMDCKYKLIYFPSKALGEPIRFLFEYLGKEYEDSRFVREDWPTVIKPSTPWGKCPVLEVNGEPVTQHIAICRYLGRLAGLNGENEWEDLRIDEIIGVIGDLRSELMKYFYENNQEWKESLKEPLIKKTVPFYMTRLDAHIKKNNGYLANGKLSWADLYFAAVAEYFGILQGADITQGYPNVKAHVAMVLSLPRIKAWVEKRPYSPS